MGAGCSCFDGEAKQQRREQEQLASQEARAKAAEAAQKRQQEFELSAIGRAARAQAAKEKHSGNANRGEPVLKWQMG
ncbi:uncharacterized protein LOC130810302 [Amaranthus tricolor]|uniref:uncharacterized protein LOC130810302 n=1 Tax=Amaranthus tricolor TaxID=29722 RepID=UPI00258BCD33|nr:uncharacterized protein LOC130810302 [Amaranthus tricolor]